MDNKELLETIVRLMPLASSDETRYHLCGVHLNPLASGLRLEVTDGHRASLRQFEDFTLKGLEKGLLLTRETLPILKTILKAYKRYKFEIEIDAQRQLLITGPCGNFSITLDDIKYPDVSVFYRSVQKTHKIGLNAKYLHEIALALGANKNAPNISIEFNSNSEPLVVTAYGNEAVLMPVKV